VFFYGFFGILLVEDGRIVNVWNNLGAVYKVFEWEGKHFISTLDFGVFQLSESGKWESVRGLEDFNQEKTVLSAFENEAGQLVLMTMGQGMYRYDGKEARSISSDVDDDLFEGVLATGNTSTGNLMVSMSSKGVFVLGSDGHLKYSVSTCRDFELSKVIQWMEGHHGVLWGVSPEAVFLLPMPVTFTQFDESHGIGVHWPKVTRIHGKLMVVSQAQLYEAVYNEAGRFMKFQLSEIPEVEGSVSAICEVEDGMIVSTTSGVYHRRDNGSCYRIGVQSNAVILKKMSEVGKKVLGFAPNRLLLYQDFLGVWEQVGSYNVPIGWVNGVLQDAEGVFWLEAGVGQVLRVDAQGRKMDVRIITTEDGLPDEWINLFAFKGRVYLSCEGRIWYWDEVGQSLVQGNPQVQSLFSYTPGVLRPLEIAEGHVLLPTENGLFILDQVGEEYELDRDTLEHMSISNSLVTPDGDRGAWINSGRNLFYFNYSTREEATPVPCPVVVRSWMMETGKRDPVPVDLDSRSELEYFRGELNFEVMVDDFHLRERMKVRYQLKGYSEVWNEGSQNRMLTFANLHEGNYSLLIQAYDSRGRVSCSKAYGFTILVPWYRSHSAYFAYVIMALLLLWLLAWLLVRRQRNISRMLEKQVELKTEELNHALRAANTASRAKSIFLANVSHEIRTPMNAVLGMTQLLKKTRLDEMQQNYLSTIRNSGQGLLNIINDVLDLSRIESGKLTLVDEAVDVGECMEKLMDLLQVQANTKGLWLGYWIHRDAWRLFRGDSQRVQQVLINLVNNAIKFTDEGHVFVEVDAKEQEGVLEWHFKVKDTGTGIRSEDLDMLFKPFSQVDHNLNRKKGGTGLGLAICRLLVEKMGGRVWASSEWGHGSTFNFTIRAKPEAGSVSNNPWDVGEIGKGRTCYVNTVHALEGELVRRYLDVWGFENVQRGTEADVLVESLSSDLVVPVSDRDISDRIFIADSWEVLSGMAADHSPNFLVSPVKHGSLLKAITLNQTVQVEESESEDITGRAFAKRYPMQVLVAEDNYINQEVLKAMLEGLGYRLAVVSDGQEVLDYFKQHQPDVILMDVQMPHMDGLEATEAIRKLSDLPRQPWIIAQSAGVMKQERERIQAVGVDDFLAKPIMEEDLIGKLKAAHEYLEKSGPSSSRGG